MTSYKTQHTETHSGNFRRKLAAYALGGLCALSAPLIENTARAQTPDPQTQQVQQAPQYQVGGVETSITNGQTQATVSTRMVVRQNQTFATLEVEGPARFTVRYYPIVNRERFPEGTAQIDRSITYSLGPVSGDQPSTTYTGTTSISQFTSVDIARDAPVVIGTPIEITLTVPAGRQRFSITEPNGFMEFVRVEALPQPVVTPHVDEHHQVDVRPPVLPRADDSVTGRRTVFAFTGDRTPFHALGPSSNSGDMNYLLADGNIWVTRNVGVLVGASFSSYGLRLDTPDSVSQLRSYSGDLTAGISLAFGRHRAMARFLGGYRYVLSNIAATADGRSVDHNGGSFEYGGELAYSYDRFFNVAAGLSNNPFNPVHVRLRGELPYGWVQDAGPYLDVTMLWLHTLTPRDDPGFIGSNSLSQNTIYLRPLLGVPLFRAGPFVPALVAGADMNFSDGGFHNGRLLGLVSARLLWDTFSVDLSGGVATAFGPVDVQPLFLLRGAYSF